MSSGAAVRHGKPSSKGGGGANSKVDRLDGWLAEGSYFRGVALSFFHHEGMSLKQSDFDLRRNDFGSVLGFHFRILIFLLFSKLEVGFVLHLIMPF